MHRLATTDEWEAVRKAALDSHPGNGKAGAKVTAACRQVMNRINDDAAKEYLATRSAKQQSLPDEGSWEIRWQTLAEVPKRALGQIAKLALLRWWTWGEADDTLFWQSRKIDRRRPCHICGTIAPFHPNG